MTSFSDPNKAQSKRRWREGELKLPFGLEDVFCSPALRLGWWECLDLASRMKSGDKQIPLGKHLHPPVVDHKGLQPSGVKLMAQLWCHLDLDVGSLCAAAVVPELSSFWWESPFEKSLYKRTARHRTLATNCALMALQLKTAEPSLTLELLLLFYTKSLDIAMQLQILEKNGNKHLL